jgi:hypothetical protein
MPPANVPADQQWIKPRWSACPGASSHADVLDAYTRWHPGALMISRRMHAA